jgi:deoxyadenosine/deoxycytidine kinase
MNSQFNAIDYSRQLQSAGVPQSQAEVHARAVAQALTDCTASKADLAALDEKLNVRLDVFEDRITTRLDAFEVRMDTFEDRITARLDAFEVRMDAFEDRINARLDAFEDQINARMDAFEARIGARVEAFEASVKLELAAMRVELAEMRGDIKFNRWMSSITLALVIAAIAKLYFP